MKNTKTFWLLVFSILLFTFSCKKESKNESGEEKIENSETSAVNDTVAVEKTKTFNDVTIEYYTMGNKEGDVVALLPGGSLNVNYMMGLAKALASKGNYVIAINPRGAGKSSGPGESLTLHDLGNDVFNVLQAEGATTACVVGHAIGNRIARMMTSDHPDMVQKVVLIAAGGKFPPNNETQKALNVIFGKGVTEEQLINSIKYMVGNPEDAPKVADIVKNSLAPNAGSVEMGASNKTPLNEWWAPKGNSKFLILQGSKDQVAVAENAIDLKKDLGERATLEYLDGAGHMMIVTRPDEVRDKIMAFLNQ